MRGNRSFRTNGRSVTKKRCCCRCRRFRCCGYAARLPSCQTNHYCTLVNLLKNVSDSGVEDHCDGHVII